MDFVINNIGKIVISALGAFLLFVVFKNFAKIKTFILEVKTELSKVSWPTRQELISSTVVVLVITGISAVFIGMVDIVLSKMLSLLFK